MKSSESTAPENDTDWLAFIANLDVLKALEAAGKLTDSFLDDEEGKQLATKLRDQWTPELRAKLAPYLPR